eukprot:11345329-Alexandrium_andersonii.AAC.1
MRSNQSCACWLPCDAHSAGAITEETPSEASHNSPQTTFKIFQDLARRAPLPQTQNHQPVMLEDIGNLKGCLNRPCHLCRAKQTWPGTTYGHTGSNRATYLLNTI